MDENYPVEEAIFVLKQGVKMGPFDMETLFDGLEEGKFSYDDICLREGAIECERLKDILYWETAHPSRDVRPSRGNHRAAPSIESIIDDDEGNEDEHFLDGERLLYAGHPSIASSPLGLFFVVGVITGGVWLYVIDPVFTLAGVGLSLLGMAYLSFMRFTQDYRITPRRIEVTTGFLARSSNEVRIEDIRAINVTCRGFTGIIGIGTVDFFTAGDAAEVSFRKIWAAQKVKTLVRRLQDTF